MKNYGLEFYIYGDNLVLPNYIGGIGYQEWVRYSKTHLFISERYNKIAKNIYDIEKMLNEGTF